MSTTSRTRLYTLTDVTGPTGAPVRIASNQQPGTTVTVRIGGRPVRYVLDDTPLYGPHAGTYAAHRADYL